MRSYRAAAIGLSALLGTAGWAESVCGQLRLGAGAAYIDLELGARLFLDKPAATAMGRLEEYRDLSSTAFFPHLRARYLTDDSRYQVNVRASNAGQTDQYVAGRVLRLGSFRLDVERDQTPHTFATTARMLGTTSERGVFELPVPRPTAAEFDNAPLIPAVRTKWTTDRVSLRLTPSPSLATTLQYTRVKKTGDRPIGQNSSFSFREVLEPIEHTVHQVRVVPALYRPNYQLQLTYDYAAFENDFAAVTAASPFTAVDGSAGAARNRSALAPDNEAHTVALQGGIRLPVNTRATTSFSYGWRRQSEPFLPYTSNTAINTNQLTVLPAAGLRGDVRTSVLTTSVSTRPLSQLSLGVRYRRFEIDDRTPPLELAGRVTTDRSLTLTPLHSERYPYTRQHLAANARWRIAHPLALQFVYGFERWDRDHEVREAARSSEHVPRVVLDFVSGGWLTLRSSYTRAQRRVDAYQQVADAQAPTLRKHDQTDRDRDRFDVMADVSLPASIGLGLSFAFAENDYPDSQHGRLDDRNRATSIDLSWTMIPRVTLTASYQYETVEVAQRSRYRVPPALLDNVSYDWQANTDDLVRTAGLGINAVVIERKLEAGATWDRSIVRSQMGAENPAPPSGGTSAQNASATVQPFPEIRYTMNPATAFLRIRLNDTWSATAHYLYDRFKQTDFRVDDRLPGAGSTGITLGVDPQNYRAQLLSLTVRYAPRVPPRTLF